MIWVLLLLLAGCSDLFPISLQGENSAEGIPATQSDENPFQLVGSTRHFKLYKPIHSEGYSVESGVALYGEIHEEAIGDVLVELFDSTDAIRNRFVIDKDGFFDDGVFQEWTFFALRVRYLEQPIGSEGMLKITDRRSGESIAYSFELTKRD